MPKRLFLIAAVAAGFIHAQPVIRSAVNAASYLNESLPNGGLSQGGMFVVIGSNLGPAAIQIVNAFPLPLTLGGTSVRAEVGGTVVNAIMVYTVASQVAAILPSNTPLGNGTLTVTFGGQTSTAFAIRVERSRFGIFALNQGGTGPGVFTDPNFAANTLLFPASPDGVWIIWGTGLGPVSGNEADLPLPGDLTTLDVVVLVGGKTAEILYRGRSGCCAGIDQIAFRVPQGVTGCYVPVVVLVDGVPSNHTTVSIANGPGPCSDAGGLQPSHFETLQSTGSLRVATVVLARTEFRLPIPPPLPAYSTRFDSVTAGFAEVDTSRLIAVTDPAGVSVDGACTVFPYTGIEPGITDPVVPNFLDAGALSINGPRGRKEIPRLASGMYSATLGGGGTPIPGLPFVTQPDYLDRGAYTLSAAGATVTAFNSQITIGDPPVWSNFNAVASVTRSQGLTVTWTGGDATKESIYIAGNSTLASRRVGAGFVCRERVAAGTFTIPKEVLLALPASEVQEGVPTGTLSVGMAANPVRFTTAGIDQGSLAYLVLTSRSVSYR